MGYPEILEWVCDGGRAWKSTGDRGPARGGADLGNLGLAYAALGERDKARDFIRQALAIFGAIESPYAEWARDRLKELRAKE
jgi:hypothetical protein